MLGFLICILVIITTNNITPNNSKDCSIVSCVSVCGTMETLCALIKESNEGKDIEATRKKIHQFWSNYVLDYSKIDPLAAFFPWNEKKYYDKLQDSVYIILYREYINFEYIDVNVYMLNEKLLDAIKDKLDWTDISSCMYLKKSTDFYKKYKDYIDWDVLKYKDVPLNLYSEPAICDYINWKEYTPYIPMYSDVLLEHRNRIEWEDLDYTTLMNSTTDINFFKEIEEYIYWPELCKVRCPFDRDFLLEFKERILWDEINYDYIPNTVFTDTRFEGKLVLDKCKYDVMKGTTTMTLLNHPVHMKYVYNYQIKRNNNSEFCRSIDYISMCEMFEDRSLFRLVNRKAWSNKDAYRYFPFCDIYMEDYNKLFHREYYIILKDKIDFLDVVKDPRIVNAFTVDQLRILENILPWNYVSQNLHLNMKIVKAFGRSLRWDHITYISLPYEIQTMVVHQFNAFKLSRHMQNDYWFQEEYINIFKWKYLDNWKPPGSPRLMELFKNYIDWNDVRSGPIWLLVKFKDYINWEYFNFSKENLHDERLYIECGNCLNKKRLTQSFVVQNSSSVKILTKYKQYFILDILKKERCHQIWTGGQMQYWTTTDMLTMGLSDDEIKAYKRIEGKSTTLILPPQHLNNMLVYWFCTICSVLSFSTQKKISPHSSTTG